MTDAVDALCSRHHYPDALRSVLHDVANACREAYPGLVSLVLSGSAATGDYVYLTGAGDDRSEPGVVRLFSDLDLMLFTEAQGAQPALLRDRLRDIKAGHPSPLFEVDISTNPARALDHIPARFQMAEARRSGVVLAGRDVIDRFPLEFDHSAAIASFLNNLWKPVLYWTPQGGPFDVEYQQMVARLFLDVPLLVCAANRECIAGHGARAEAYLAEDSRDGLYSETLRERVRWAIDARRSPSTQREGLERNVGAFVNEVVASIDGGPPLQGLADPDLVARLAALLPKRPLRRLAAELRCVVREPRAPLRDLAWWRCRKEATAGAALLGLLGHLGDIDGRVDAFDPPREALARLAEFARVPGVERTSGETPRAFFFRCKRIYRHGLLTLFPSMEKPDARHRVFLESDDG